MKLVMTLKIRDEEDILEQNLRFHMVLGVDHLIVLDNNSRDGTVKILERYERAGLATVIRDDTDDLRGNDSKWATRMALQAFEMGADWTFHNDADEFWWPLHGDLKQALAGIPDRYGAVVCPRSEFVGIQGPAKAFDEHLVVRESRSNLQAKLMHRARPDVVFWASTQEAVAAPDGDVLRALRPPGRAVIRAVRDRDVEPEPVDRDAGLVWAPSWPVRVFHFPLRSFEQFETRARLALEAGGWRDEGRLRRLKETFEQGQVADAYADLTYDEAAIEAGLEAGDLVRDERIARFLERCPDPLVEPGRVEVTSSAEDLQREREEVTYDAMRLIARTQQFATYQAERVRERHLHLKARAERRDRRARQKRRELRAKAKRKRSLKARLAGPVYRLVFRKKSRKRSSGSSSASAEPSATFES
ncbi:hypothetical protein BH10ACT11_BH10ACT11_03270 [soil metagenome]